MIGSFTKNTLITIFVQGIIFILGLAMSVVIARILGPEKKGIYSLAMLLPTFLMYFTNLGIGQATVFYLGKGKYSLKEVFGNNILYTIAISILAILIGLVIIFFFSNKLFPGIAIKYLLLALLVVPGQLFMSFILYILLGLQKIKNYNFILFLRSFLSFIFVGIFLWSLHLGVKAAIMTDIFSFMIVCVILFFMTKKEVHGIKLKLNRDYLKDALTYGIQFYVGSILYFLHSGITMPLINIFLNPMLVGFYSLSLGLTDKLWLVSDAVGTVLFPKISAENDGKKKKEFTPLIFRNITFLITLFAIFLSAIGHWLIIFLYSDAFLDSVKPFRILLVGSVALGGWKILENDLKGRGKPILNSYITGFSVCLNLALNIFLIPKFGILGAAWATSISYVTVLLVALIIYCRVSKNRFVDVIFIKISDIVYYKNYFYSLIEKT